MNVSVAACSYNGGEYVQPQLESIVNQTRPPDEIVIYDDCSTDGTQTILTEYAEKYPKLIQLYLSDENVGLNKNFQRAISACSGDVVAIADQDDVWHPEKLERQVDVFRSQEVGLVFHNSTVATESLNPITTLWETLKPEFTLNNNRPDEQFRSLARRNYVQGASMLFDSSLQEYCLPIPENWVYDYWIAVVAAYRRGIYGIDETLLTYRQHENQVIGASDDGIINQVKKSRSVGREQYQSNVDQWTTLSDKIKNGNGSEAVVNQAVAERIVKNRIQYSKSRVEIYDSSLRSGIRCLAENIWRRDY